MVMKSIKNGWYPEKGTVWNVCWIFCRINRKGIAIFYHKEDRIAIFCRLKDVFCFTGDWAESDIFQRKNGKLQQILSTILNTCLLTSAPPEQILCLQKCWRLQAVFFVPFVAVSQGFTEISAANRESLNWTSGSVFWIKNRVSLCFYRTQVLTIEKFIKR